MPDGSGVAEEKLLRVGRKTSYSSAINSDASKLMGQRDEISPIFGLSMMQIHPIVEVAAGEAIAEFEISFECQIEGHYGFAAEKLIPTFSYTAADGGEGRVTIFVKYPGNPNSPEAEHYRYLTALGAPIPRLYGELCNSESRRVLFIEYLDASRRARSTDSTAGLLDLISLMARFNAIRPAGEYEAWLQQKPLCWEVITAELQQIEESIWENAQQDKLGDGLRLFCASHKADLAKLQLFTQRICSQVAELETGFLHNDLSRRNVGRNAAGELVALDLELVGVGPRFADVAEWTGSPESFWNRPEKQQDLAEHYLNEYARWGSSPPTLEQFLKETRLLLLFSRIGPLGFTLNYSKTDSPDRELRPQFRQGLLENLTFLIDEYC